METLIFVGIVLGLAGFFLYGTAFPERFEARRVSAPPVAPRVKGKKKALA